MDIILYIATMIRWIIVYVYIIYKRLTRLTATVTSVTLYYNVYHHPLGQQATVAYLLLGELGDAFWILTQFGRCPPPLPPLEGIFGKQL